MTRAPAPVTAQAGGPISGEVFAVTHLKHRVARLAYALTTLAALAGSLGAVKKWT